MNKSFTDNIERRFADEYRDGIDAGRMGVMGYDGLSVATRHSPKVATVDIHPEEIGKKAESPFRTRHFRL
ncbi:MAG: hypothetical protein GXP32_00955 [Kiritimatiellaeota bacterium]|nr:hypothetical protein [Kiritimatiellota bacterium]